MTDLKFNDGYKELAVNGDENRIIRFNPSDFNIMDRLKKASEKLDSLTDGNIEYDIEEAARLDGEIRRIINEVFGSDVCSPAFGNANCLSLAGGQPVFMNFLEAIAPIIKQSCAEERKKSEKKIKKYTEQLS